MRRMCSRPLLLIPHPNRKETQMKKIFIAGLISGLFSAGAFAAACGTTGGAQTASSTAAGEQCVCAGGQAVKSTVEGGKGQAVAAPRFLQTGFDVQCSANTMVSYNEVSPTAFAVASGSRKGNQSFRGSSAGGGIAVHDACPTSGCTPTEVSAANVQAALDSSS